MEFLGYSYFASTTNQQFFVKIQELPISFNFLLKPDIESLHHDEKYPPIGPKYSHIQVSWVAYTIFFPIYLIKSQK